MIKKYFKFFLVVCFCLSLLFCVTACGNNSNNTASDGDNSEDTTSTGQPASAEENKEVGIQDRTLTVCFQNAISSFSPDGGSMMGQGQLMRQVFETLFERTADGELVPWLAESYEWVSSTELVIKLREGIKFNNGEDFTGDDVLYTFKLIQDNHSTAFDYVSNIDIAESYVEDGYTVHLVLSAPTPDLCEMLQHPFTGIRCKSASTDYTVIESAVGTGPYMIESFVPGASYTLTINENYWNEDAFPHVRTIVFTVINDGTTRTNEALAGTTNLVYDMNSADADLFRDNPDVKYYEAATGGSEYLTINTNGENEALKNPLVREAVFYAIDRDAVVKAGHGTYGKVQTSLFADIDGEVDTSEYSGSYDPEKAKSLLEEAGYGEGKISLEITVTNSNQGRMDEAEAIASQLNAVGINASINPVAGNVCQEMIMQGTTDMAIYGVTATTFEASMMLRKYLPDSVYFKMFSLENQELFDLINEAQEITDVDERYAMYAEAQELIAQSYCAYPLWNMTYSAISTNDIGGFWMSVSYQQHLLQYVYFEE